MTLKDSAGLYYSPKITPIWKISTYKANLSKNNADFMEKSYALLVPEREMMEEPNVKEYLF